MTYDERAAGIPADPDGITPEWLTAVLRRDGDLRVDAVEVEPIGVCIGIMSVLFRVTPTYGSGRGPATVVVKLAPPYEQVRQVAAGYRFYEREVEIYRNLAHELALRPPELFYAAHDPATDDFVIVMEDLGHLHSCDQLQGCGRDEARLVVREMARHHAHWWRDERLGTLPFIQSAAEAPYPQYHEQSTKEAWPVLLERFGDSIPDPIRALGERWNEIGPPIMVGSDDHPATLLHGDLRLDNLFFAADGESVYALDWQISFAGGGPTDLAYFTSQSLAVDERRATEADLTRLYHDTLVANGVTDYPFDEFWDDYRRAVLFCFGYPLTGGAVELVNDRAMALAKAMLERSIAAIEDLDAQEMAP
jgi:hypothetical protein